MGAIAAAKDDGLSLGTSEEEEERARFDDGGPEGPSLLADDTVLLRLALAGEFGADVAEGEGDLGEEEGEEVDFLEEMGPPPTAAPPSV